MAQFFYLSEKYNERAEEMVKDIPQTFHAIIRDLWEGRLEHDEFFFGNFSREEQLEKEFEVLQKVSNQVRAAINSLKVSPPLSAKTAYPPGASCDPGAEIF